MLFTKAIFTAALLATSVIALPLNGQVGDRQLVRKSSLGTRSFFKCSGPAPSPEVAVATQPPPTPTPTPTPSPAAAPEVHVQQAQATPESSPSPAPAAQPAQAETVKVQSQDQPQSGWLNSDFQAGLDLHNTARAEIGVASITYSDSLASEAAAYAQQLASIGSLQHASDRNGHGENLYWQSMSDTPCQNGANSWSNEKGQYYGQSVGDGDFGSYGHYTQMVWATTTEVGFGTATDSNGGVYVVARYNPAGNMLGETPTTAS